MSLRRYIQSHPETIQDLELSTIECLWEGLELLSAGRRRGGVYLLGYVAEMVLKNACFLFDGARPADLVSPRLGPVRHLGKSHFPAVRFENYHSLVFWYHALLHKRSIASRPLPRALGRQLGRRVARIHGTWIVAMRYYPDARLDSAGAADVYDDVVWMYDNRLQLRI